MRLPEPGKWLGIYKTGQTPGKAVMAELIDTEEIKNHPGRWIKWSAAIYAGLIAAAVLIFLERGIPWASSGFAPEAIMGREVESPGGGLGFAIIFIQLAVGVVYVLLLAPVIHRMNAFPAIMTGGLLGLVFYFLNTFVFNLIDPPTRVYPEFAAVVAHIVFGLIAAAAYKGMIKPRIPA
jgi:uncharacterized membrane protein YeiB